MGSNRVTKITILFLGILLVASMLFFVDLKNDYKDEVNKERQDYNNLLKKYIEKNPYKLGDVLIPAKTIEE